MKLELKSIGTWSLIKISVFINMIMGFIFGIFYAFMMYFMSSAGLLPLDMVGDEDVTLLGMIIFVPIMFSIGAAVFGTIWAVVCVFIYNLLGKIIGGLEIEVEDTSVKNEMLRPQQMAPSLYNTTDKTRAVVTPPPTPPIPPRPEIKKDVSPDEGEIKKDQGSENNNEI